MFLRLLCWIAVIIILIILLRIEILLRFVVNRRGIQLFIEISVSLLPSRS